MGSISFGQGRGSRYHNMRQYPDGKMPDNINPELTSENVVWKDETLRRAYTRIFGDAVKEYNAKQKRQDRKIKSYYAQIKNSKNKEKLFYEDVVQWGKMADYLEHPEYRQVAKECLLEYLEGFEERNPNLEIIGAYIHMDEASPHLHLDYIPVATGYSRGLKKRNGLTKALENMGIVVKGASKHDNASMVWKARERKVFGDICRAHNLVVDKEISTPERDTLSVLDYKKQMRQEEVLQLKAQAKQLEGEILDTIQVNKLNISKPLLGQKVKVPYTDYANLQATAKEIDRVRDEAATETQKAVAMMRDAQQLMNNANDIISERDYIISEAREQAVVEAKKEKEGFIAKLLAKIKGLEEKIRGLEEKIKELLFEEKELSEEISELKIEKIQVKKDTQNIIDDAHVQGACIIETYERKAGNGSEFMAMKELLGIVPAEELQKARDMLKQAHQEALPYMDSWERDVLRNPFEMSAQNLERAYDNRKHMMYGCEGELSEELCAFVRLKEVAYKYQELDKKPKNVEELIGALHKSSKYIKH